MQSGLNLLLYPHNLLKGETARQEVILLCVESADLPETMSIVNRS